MNALFVCRKREKIKCLKQEAKLQLQLATPLPGARGEAAAGETAAGEAAPAPSSQQTLKVLV